MALNETTALEAEYLRALKALDGDAESIANADTYLSSTHANHRGGSLSWSAVPLILNDAQVNVLSSAARSTASIMNKVSELYLRDADFRARFGFSEELERLTCVPTGYGACVPLARVDLCMSPRTGAFRIERVAVDGFTGMTSTVEVTRAVKTTEAYREFAKKHSDIGAFDAVEALEQTLRETYRSWANAETGTRHPEHPAVGIVGYPESADLDEVADLAERLGERGVFARFVDVCNLRVETAAGASRLVDDDGPIDCVYRLATAADIAGRPCPGTEALVEAARRGLACVIGGFSTWSCATEAFFSALRAPELASRLDADELAFIEQHLPEGQAASQLPGAGETELGLFVFGGELAGVFPASAEKDIMGNSPEHVYRGCLVVHE